MATEYTYRYDTISPEEISASDLRADIKGNDKPVLCARVHLSHTAWESEHAETADLVLWPTEQIAGIAWGADADYINHVTTIEQAIDRWWLGDAS